MDRVKCGAPFGMAIRQSRVALHHELPQTGQDHSRTAATAKRLTEKCARAMLSRRHSSLASECLSKVSARSCRPPPVSAAAVQSVRAVIRCECDIERAANLWSADLSAVSLVGSNFRCADNSNAIRHPKALRSAHSLLSVRDRGTCVAREPSCILARCS